MTDDRGRFEVRATADSHFSWIRTRLSVERTLRSWMRTAVALIGFGFTIVQFLERLPKMSGTRHPQTRHGISAWRWCACPAVLRWPAKVRGGRVSNAMQSHEDIFVTLAAAAGLPDLKEKLLAGHKMGDTTYKVHLDGYNNLDLWTGKSEKSARREFYYYDETDLMAVRIDHWKMHIGVKKEGSWWNEKSYPSVPYLFNLLMDPMEKINTGVARVGLHRRKFFAAKLWAPTAAAPFLLAHLKSLQDFPPSQGADTLSMHKAIETAMRKMESPHGSSN